MKKQRRWQIRIHPAGAALFGLALLFAPSHLALAAAIALVWHELSHLAVMLCLGAKHCTVELTPFGGMIDALGFERLAPWRQAVCALAGVAGSLIGAGICVALPIQSHFGLSMFQMHLSLALANCLPAWPLDGAQVLSAAAACFGREDAMRKCLTLVSRFLGVGMVLMGLYGVWLGHINLSLLTAGPYLIYAARQKTLADRVRCMHAGRTKMKNQPLLPVRLVASINSDLHSRLPVWVGQWGQNQYHMLCELDENGRLKHLWTEEEIWEKVLGRIGTEQK